MQTLLFSVLGAVLVHAEFACIDSADAACNTVDVDHAEGLQLMQKKGTKLAAIAEAKASRPHESGHRAAMNENGYQAVAQLKNDVEMEAYIRRAANHLGLEIHDEDGKLPGIVPFYSGTRTVQSFENLLLELEKNANNGEDREQQWISTVSLMQTSGAKVESSVEAEESKPHESGHRAAMNERGYQAVAQLKNDAEMEAYIRRAANHLGLEVHDEDGILPGIVPFYSGTRTVQNFENLLLELEKSANNGEERDQQWISPMSLMQTSGAKAESTAEAKDSRPHESGHRAAMNERGYQAVAQLKNDAEMEAYIRRAANHLGLEVHDEDGILPGIVPFYSGTRTVQSFENLLLELEKSANNGEDRDQQWISTVSLMQTSGAKAESNATAKESRPHESGHRAAINEKGYRAVAQLKNDVEMEAYIRRAANHLGLEIHDEDGVLPGIVPFYSGTKASQNLENLLLELEKSANNGEERDAQWISPVVGLSS